MLDLLVELYTWPLFWLVWALLGFIPAAIAGKKGRNFLGWWVFGVLLFIVALPAALLVKPEQKAAEAAALAGGEMRKCPECAELIRVEARKCRYCGSVVEPQAPAVPSASKPTAAQ